MTDKEQSSLIHVSEHFTDMWQISKKKDKKLNKNKQSK